MYQKLTRHILVKKLTSFDLSNILRGNKLWVEFMSFGHCCKQGDAIIHEIKYRGSWQILRLFFKMFVWKSTENLTELC